MWNQLYNSTKYGKNKPKSTFKSMQINYLRLFGNADKRHLWRHLGWTLWSLCSLAIFGLRRFFARNRYFFIRNQLLVGSGHFWLTPSRQGHKRPSKLLLAREKRSKVYIQILNSSSLNPVLHTCLVGLTFTREIVSRILSAGLLYRDIVQVRVCQNKLKQCCVVPFQQGLTILFIPVQTM